MYCSNCGHPNPDSANFCQKCGTKLQVAATVKQPASEVQYETIEIEAKEAGVYWGTSVFSSLLGGTSAFKCQFVARHVTPVDEDVAVVGEFLKFSTSPLEELASIDRTNAQEALDEVNQYFLKAGWLPMQRGRFWYSYRYRFPWNGKHEPLIGIQSSAPPQKKKGGCFLTMFVTFPILIGYLFLSIAINQNTHILPDFLEQVWFPILSLVFLALWIFVLAKTRR